MRVRHVLETLSSLDLTRVTYVERSRNAHKGNWASEICERKTRAKLVGIERVKSLAWHAQFRWRPRPDAFTGRTNCSIQEDCPMSDASVRYLQLLICIGSVSQSQQLSRVLLIPCCRTLKYRASVSRQEALCKPRHSSKSTRRRRYH
jgi:hypothetical protein